MKTVKTDSAYLLKEEEQLVTEDTILQTVMATAKAARAIERKKGNGNRVTCNLVACGALLDGIDECITNISVLSRISEGRKDRHARLPERLLLTRPTTTRQLAWAIIDPLEGEGPFALKGRRPRASTTLLALTPKGSLPKVDSAQRVRYVCLPPGSPISPGQIEIDSEPEMIVKWMRKRFGCDARDIIVTILKRAWTDQISKQFEAAGATVEHIMAGDFQAFIEAGSPVKPGAPIRISVGIGGLPEAFLAIPYLKWSGGIMLMQVVPLGMEMHADQACDFVFDKDSMIRSNDCLLAVAGLTEADVLPGSVSGTRYLVPGVRRSATTKTVWVSVLIASPMLDSLRSYVVEFDSSGTPALSLLEGNESLEEYLLSRYFLSGNAIEIRVVETREGDRHYFQQWWGSFVPGLESLTEREFINLLHALENRGRITRAETVHPWDTCEYQVIWAASS